MCFICATCQLADMSQTLGARRDVGRITATEPGGASQQSSSRHDALFRYVRSTLHLTGNSLGTSSHAGMFFVHLGKILHIYAI